MSQENEALLELLRTRVERYNTSLERVPMEDFQVMATCLQTRAIEELTLVVKNASRFM